MKKTLAIAAIMLSSMSMATAQQTTITETTTTVVSTSDYDALKQAYITIKLLNGKEMKLSGKLYKDSNPIQGLPDKYTLVTNDLTFIVQLDDGRATTRKARACKTHSIYDHRTPKGSKCNVTMDAEISTYLQGYIQLTATGWNVEFSDEK